MNATSFLGAFFVRVGLVPALALFLVVLLRRLALRNGRARPPLLSLETFNVGFDLFVLAMVTSFTALIDRSTALARTNRQMASDEQEAMDAAAVAALYERTGELANGQLVSASVVMINLILAVLVASTVSSNGYEKLAASPGRRSKSAPEEPTLTRWGVLMPFALGLLALIMALVTSR